MPESSGYRYAYSAKQIEDILKKIKDTGRPDKLTIGYIQNTWLFKNAQYGAMIDILKDMNFLDESNSPTDLYAKYQNDSHSKEALKEGVLNLYPALFKAYPNANELPKETIAGFLKQHTGAEKSIINRLYTTFNRLCSMTDFNGGTEVIVDEPIIEAHEKKKTNKPKSNPSIPISMNIQIVIPSDATAEQYDKIFSSIKNNLID